MLTSRYQVAGDPVIVALAVHTDDQGDVVCDTLWTSAGLDAGVYAMLDARGQHVASLPLPADLVNLHAGVWTTGCELMPTEAYDPTGGSHADHP
jgi:hypothetical protein